MLSCLSSIFSILLLLLCSFLHSGAYSSCHPTVSMGNVIDPNKQKTIILLIFDSIQIKNDSKFLNWIAFLKKNQYGIEAFNAMYDHELPKVTLLGSYVIAYGFFFFRVVSTCSSHLSAQH